MIASEVKFYEVETSADLPAQLEVGVQYFVITEGRHIINHGNGQISDYGFGQPAEDPEAPFDPATWNGTWPISKGGTGGNTATIARANLGAMGFNDNASSASRLAMPHYTILNGDVSGSASGDGSQDIIVTTTLDPALLAGKEDTANKVSSIRSAANATNSTYPTELATRLELDKKANKTDAVGAYKGIFATDALLKAAYPSASAGDNATVLSTNTIWYWDSNTLTWLDSGSAQGGTAVQTVNGKPGPDVVLDIGDDLNGYTMAEVDAKLATLSTAVDGKLSSSAIAADRLAAIAANTTASSVNPFQAQSEVTAAISTAVTAESQARVAADTAETTARTTADTAHDTAISELQGDVNATHAIPCTVQLTQTIGEVTVIPKSDFPGGMQFAPGKTIIYDPSGTIGVYSADADASNINVITMTIGVQTQEQAKLLGNVDSYYDMPFNQAQSQTIFSKGTNQGDRLRVVHDERNGGATVEYYALTINVPVTVLLGVMPNAIGNEPENLFPTVTAAVAHGFITPIVGDRYGVYDASTTPYVWKRYYVTAIDGDNITWGPIQDWAKDGDDIPANFTVRPDIAWGSPLIINTSNYQAQTMGTDTGKIPVIGSTDGTWGTPMSAVALNAGKYAQIDLYVPGKFSENTTDEQLSVTAKDSFVWRAPNCKIIAAYGWCSTYATAVSMAVYLGSKSGYDMAATINITAANTWVSGLVNTASAVNNTLSTSDAITIKAISSAAGNENLRVSLLVEYI